MELFLFDFLILRASLLLTRYPSKASVCSFRIILLLLSLFPLLILIISTSSTGPQTLYKIQTKQNQKPNSPAPMHLLSKPRTNKHVLTHTAPFCLVSKAIGSGTAAAGWLAGRFCCGHHCEEEF